MDDKKIVIKFHAVQFIHTIKLGLTKKLKKVLVLRENLNYSLRNRNKFNVSRIRNEKDIKNPDE